jgi:transcriptional regulator with XRE-family HTH domain
MAVWDKPRTDELKRARAEEALALKEMRERKGVTLEELAEQAKVPLEVLEQLEDPLEQTTLLDSDTLTRILQALGADFSTIPRIKS